MFFPAQSDSRGKAKLPVKLILFFPIFLQLRFKKNPASSFIIIKKPQKKNFHPWCNRSISFSMTSPKQTLGLCCKNRKSRRDSFFLSCTFKRDRLLLSCFLCVVHPLFLCVQAREIAKHFKSDGPGILHTLTDCTLRIYTERCVWLFFL